MTEEFTRSGYRELLCGFLDLGYEVRGFSDAEPGKRHLILRHDLDMSLQAAEPIADIEAELGLQARYFILLRTEMYNPFSQASRRSIARLLELGHEVGLHLDASLYSDHAAALNEAAKRECEALEVATGRAVTTISFHRPAKSLLGHNQLIAGRLHAYQPKFFEKMGYCSDSRGAWHHGHPLRHEAVKAGRALQLLTHPIWWRGEGGEDPVEKLNCFCAERQKLLTRELAANCEPYRAYLYDRKDR